MSDSTMTPEGRRCPECGKDAGQVTGRTGYCPSCGAHFAIVPTPAPVGGEAPSIVLLNARRDPSYSPYCMRCAGLQRMRKVEDFYWRCPACPAEHDERENAKRPATPTSAEGGEGQRVAQRLAENITTLVKRWHGVGNPDHEPMALGHMLPALAVDAKFLNSLLASPTLAATGGEEEYHRAVLCLTDSTQCEHGTLAECDEAVLSYIDELRRQLAEAEEMRDIYARACTRWGDLFDRRGAKLDRCRASLRDAEERATTAERRLEEAIRALGTEARMRGSAQQEVARLREALAFAASCIKSGESWTPTCAEIIGGALSSPHQSTGQGA